MIPLILLHIALAAQVGQMRPGQTQFCDVLPTCTSSGNCTCHGVQMAKPLTPSEFDQICGERAQVGQPPPNKPCPMAYCSGANNFVGPIPAEHVIEIRTKRVPSNKMQVCWLITTGDGSPCEVRPYTEMCPQTASCSRAYDEHKTLWIDGQLIGVIKEVEEDGK